MGKAGVRARLNVQMPFANGSGAVASRLEKFCDGIFGARKAELGVDVEVGDHAIAHAQPSSEQRGARYRADRRPDVEIGESNAFGRELVQVRRHATGCLRPVRSEVTPPPVVGEEDNEVGLCW